MDNKIYKKTAIILMAAGKSTRFGSKTKELKQFYLLGDKPLYRYSLDFFLKYDFCQIIVVVPEDYSNKFSDFKNNDTFVNFICGGNSRTDSVYNSLLYLKNNNFDITYCIIHDVARPFIDEKILSNILKEIKNSPSLTCAIKVNDTIGYGEQYIEKYLDRKHIYLIQTPQAFSFNLIMDCYEKYINDNDKKQFTDDTSLVFEYSKINPKIVEGSSNLFKITNFEDLEFANFLLNKKLK
ncbi:MAG TPA: IspD/TarI family cytidylyltransferase [Exilispira sp.]|nr:IspD/TarI family cytidylyltransferase [Exilispira sp.]